MSSRSNGVMNELFTLRMISCVASSAGVLDLAHAGRDGLALGRLDARGAWSARGLRRRGMDADVANRS